MATPRIAIITDIIPHYREGFYDRILNDPTMSVTVFCQSSLPGSGVATIHEKYAKHVCLVPHVSWRGQMMVWHRLPWRRIAAEYDIVFVDGNPRMLSQSLLATILRLFRRKVVIWNMAWSYRGKWLTEAMRLAWWRLFDAFFVYTDRDIQVLRDRGFHNAILVAANNGLDQAKIDRERQKWSPSELGRWQELNGIKDRSIILSCARLGARNRFDEFAIALTRISAQQPDVLWCVIGDGPDRQRVQSILTAHRIEDKALFVGAIHDESELAPWFLSAMLLVHPGAIGLTLMHAFGYGLPVVTHNNARRHGPEFAVFADGVTGRSFDMGEVDQLCEVVLDLLQCGGKRERMREAVVGIVRDRHNTDVMARRFADVVAKLGPVGPRDSINPG